MSHKKQALAGSLARFVQEYGRKAQKGTEPNDRRYDRKTEDRLKRLAPQQLSDLLDGDFESDSEVTVDCVGVQSEAAFWETYLSAVKPQGAELFGRNLDAFWDAVEGGGPGSPNQSRLVFENTVVLTRFGDGRFLAALEGIAKDCTRMEIVLA
jgi:hypothetical protein